MPRLPNVLDDEDLFDHVILAGVRSPGIVKISGHNRKVDWDVKVAPGNKGASTELKGIPPVEFTCEFTLTDDEDFVDWSDFLDLINSTVAGATPKALDIYHPDLAEQNIKSVVKAGTEGTKHDGKGGQIKVVRFQEYAPPKPKSGSLSGSSSNADSKREREKRDPNEKAKQELAGLLDQYQNTPWG